MYFDEAVLLCSSWMIDQTILPLTSEHVSFSSMLIPGKCQKERVGLSKMQRDGFGKL